MNLTGTLVRTLLNATAPIVPALAGRGAVTLYRFPHAQRTLSSAEEQLMATAWTGSMTVAGKNVVTYHWGDGDRPVLLVHGWRSRASHFGAFIAALRAAGYTPVTFDAPAHGASAGSETTVLEYREIITALYEEHGRFDAVVAHSLGGAAAVLALRGPAEAGRLVVLSGVSDFDYVVDWFCADRGLSPRVRRLLRRRIELDLFPGEKDIWRRFDAAHRPEEVTLPILLIHDEGDRMISADQAHRTAAAYGEQARLVLTRGLGHGRILTDPDVLATALDFVSAGERLRN